MARDEGEEEMRKNPPRDLSEIEADCHGEGVDLVAAFALEPVTRTDFAAIFAVSDNGLDGIATFLAASLDRGDLALLTGQNDPSVILDKHMPRKHPRVA